MAELETVIKGLECCVKNMGECELCPYDEGQGKCGCGKQLYADALALLKAQEPRVMTLEEVKSAWRNRNIAFLVEYNDGGNPVWMLYYGDLLTREEIMLMPANNEALREMRKSA